MWHFIYHLGSEQLDLLKSFTLERNVDYLGKWVVQQAVVRVGLDFPERKAEIIDWYESVTDHFIENHDDASLADPEVSSNIVCDLCDLNAVHLLPKIEQLYDLGLVNEGIPGDFKSIEKDIHKSSAHRLHKVFDNIFDHYTHIVATWYGYSQEYREKQAQLRKKTGRKKPFRKLFPRPLKSFILGRN